MVWERNYNNPFFQETLQNITRLAEEEFGEVTLVSSKKMEQGRAFAELLKGNIDVFIGSADAKREVSAKAIYVPLDRGLLGFRVCLVNKNSPKFDKIKTPLDFIQRNLKVGLGSHWPDRFIYEENGFKVITSPVYDSLFEMLKLDRFDCFSRSVNEIAIEVERFKETDIVQDDHIVFIYPNADFIFTNLKNESLQKRLDLGVNLSIEDNSFYEIFEKYFEATLMKNGIYERKLMIINNARLTPDARAAINRFGIASFVLQPLPSPSNKSENNQNKQKNL